jgi:eukaryotic-like serine/threonine-protein kinase
VGFLGKLFGVGGSKRGRVDISKRFDVRGRQGQGSMSKVFHAFDKKLGRTVCLKVLDKEKTAKFEERFKLMGVKKPSEGQVCELLRHPSVVRTYDHGLSTAGEPFVVMEWIEGLGLNYLIETKSAQLQGNRINYLVQICDAIDYMHGQKFLHRDICPRNVMIDKEGVVKLIDFGLTVPYTPEFCRPGNRTGTPDYLAPEIIKRKETDNRVDLFALGVTAFEVFTGRLPWERSLSSEETLRKHLNSPPNDPKDFNPNLDDDVVAVVMKSIEKDRDLRYSTAREFKEALQRLKRQDY